MHFGPWRLFGGGWRSPVQIDPRLVRVIDSITYAASAMMVLFTLHQAALVWSLHDVSGVSFVAWLSYTIGAFVWFMYGYAHRDTFIIITSFIWVILAAFVTAGVMLFG